MVEDSPKTDRFRVYLIATCKLFLLLAASCGSFTSFETAVEPAVFTKSLDASSKDRQGV